MKLNPVDFERVTTIFCGFKFLCCFVMFMSIKEVIESMTSDSIECWRRIYVADPD